MNWFRRTFKAEVRYRLWEIQELILSNQETVDAYAARIDAAAEVQLAATVANTDAVNALRAEVAAGTVEVPLDTTALEAATAKGEAAAAAAIVPPEAFPAV